MVLPLNRLVLTGVECNAAAFEMNIGLQGDHVGIIQSQRITFQQVHDAPVDHLGEYRHFLQLVRERGKGSHGTLYLGNRYTIMKDRKKEIGPGLLKKMLTDLGLDKSDIE